MDGFQIGNLLCAALHIPPEFVRRIQIVIEANELMPEITVTLIPDTTLADFDWTLLQASKVTVLVDTP